MLILIIIITVLQFIALEKKKKNQGMEKSSKVIWTCLLTLCANKSHKTKLHWIFHILVCTGLEHISVFIG